MRWPVRPRTTSTSRKARTGASRSWCCARCASRSTEALGWKNSSGVRLQSDRDRSAREVAAPRLDRGGRPSDAHVEAAPFTASGGLDREDVLLTELVDQLDRKSTRLNSSHLGISYAVFC